MADVTRSVGSSLDVCGSGVVGSDDKSDVGADELESFSFTSGSDIIVGGVVGSVV